MEIIVSILLYTRLSPVVTNNIATFLFLWSEAGKNLVTIGGALSVLTRFEQFSTLRDMIHLDFRFLIVVVGLTVAGVFLTSSAMGQSMGDVSPPQQGILLLQNGQVFFGRLTQSGDRFFVAMESGGISVRAEEVDCWCRSLKEVYQARKRYWNQNDVESHLQMASWCHRQGLLDEAEYELQSARSMEPGNPRIRLIQLRVEAARILKTRQTQPVELKTTSVVKRDFDRVISQLPPGTVEDFTRSIQPILINGCTTAGCHGPNTAHGVEFDRVPLGQVPSQRMTHRNLEKTLRWVNREKPLESVLLTVPSRAHGTSSSPIFTPQKRGQYEQLVRWVERLSVVPDPIEMEPGTLSEVGEPIRHASYEVPEIEGQTVRAVFTSPLLGRKGARTHEEQEEPIKTPFADPNATFGEVDARVKWGANLKQFSPVDPFDPEIFNRRHFNRRHFKRSEP